MPLILVCQTCRGVLPLPDDFAGDIVRCGNCAGLIPIPKVSSEPTKPAAPPPAPTTVFNSLTSDAPPVNASDIVFGDSSSARSRRAAKASEGTKTIVIIMWSLIAAVTVGTVSLVGWLISQPKKVVIVEQPPEHTPTKTSTVSTPATTPTTTHTTPTTSPSETPITTPKSGGSLTVQSRPLSRLISGTFSRRAWFWAIEADQPNLLMKYSAVNFERLAAIPLPGPAIRVESDSIHPAVFVALQSGPILQFDIDSIIVDGVTVHAKEVRRHNESSNAPVTGLVEMTGKGSEHFLIWSSGKSNLTILEMTNPLDFKLKAYEAEPDQSILAIANNGNRSHLAVLTKFDSAERGKVTFLNPATVRSEWSMTFDAPAPPRTIAVGPGPNVVTVNAPPAGSGRLTLVGVGQKSGRMSTETIPPGSVIKSSRSGRAVFALSPTGSLSQYDADRWHADESKAKPALLATLPAEAGRACDDLFVSPDGKVVILKSGHVVGVSETADPYLIAMAPAMPAPNTPAPNPPTTPATPTTPEMVAMPIPKATELNKCTVYMPFDGPSPEEAMTDMVTKRRVGQGIVPNFTLVEGKRGQAMRITFTQRETGRMDISEHTSKLDFRIGQTMTLAYWVRFPNPIRDNTIVFGMSGKGDLKLVTGLADTTGQKFTFELNHTITKTKKDYIRLQSDFKDGPTAWNHFAMTRGENGKLNAYFNGAPMVGENKAPVDLANFNLAGFGFSMANRGGEFDLDEMAIYSRALPETEIKKLAGWK